jgi:hypothetical protein
MWSSVVTLDGQHMSSLGLDESATEGPRSAQPQSCWGPGRNATSQHTAAGKDSMWSSVITLDSQQQLPLCVDQTATEGPRPAYLITLQTLCVAHKGSNTSTMQRSLQGRLAAKQRGGEWELARMQFTAHYQQQLRSGCEQVHWVARPSHLSRTLLHSNRWFVGWCASAVAAAACRCQAPCEVTLRAVGRRPQCRHSTPENSCCY